MKYRVNINKWHFLLPSLLLLLASGCTKNFDELNKPLGKLSLEELGTDNYTGESYIKNLIDWAYPLQENRYQHVYDLAGNQLVRYTANVHDQFPAKSFVNFKDNDGWSGWAYSQVWTNITSSYNSLLKEKGESDILTMWGKILRVQALLVLTDTYGPFPIGTADDPTAFVSQQEVYKHMIEELNSATTMISGFLVTTPDLKLLPTADIAYNGDISKWVRYANSLKLRIAIRMSGVAPDVARPIAEKAIQDGVIEKNEDNMSVAYLSPGFYKVAVEWNDVRMSADMRSFLVGYNDPRLPKLFHPTADGNYYGCQAGISIGNKATAGALYSRMIFPMNSRTVYFNAAETAFLRAEGALLGWEMGGTPKQFYEQGVQLSFEERGAGSAEQYLQDSQSKPASHVEPANGYGTNKMAASQVTIAWDDNATNDVKLEKIMTQKWLALYPNGPEGWADVRRTGYPRLLPLTVSTPGYVINIPNRIPYPSTERINNPDGYQQMVSLLGGENNYATKMWWQKH